MPAISPAPTLASYQALRGSAVSEPEYLHNVSSQGFHKIDNQIPWLVSG
jgi:hypothetical protein